MGRWLSSVDDAGESSANLDYRLNLDLMRMGVVPGALVSVRGQSRFGGTVNEAARALLAAGARDVLVGVVARA